MESGQRPIERRSSARPPAETADGRFRHRWHRSVTWSCGLAVQNTDTGARRVEKLATKGAIGEAEP
jgi:hypothetical protein